MILPPQEYHYSAPPTLLILFDLSNPAAVERLHRKRAARQEYSNVEASEKTTTCSSFGPAGPVVGGLNSRERFLKVASIAEGGAQ